MKDRSKLKVGTRTDELLFQIILALDELNEKLEKPVVEKEVNTVVPETNKTVPKTVQKKR